jgi:uncharacterized protein YraI
MRLPLFIAAVALALPTAVSAAEPTARVSGDIAVRSGPGSDYRAIGRLESGTRVSLDYCTRDDRWCLVSGTGWVNASYLIGWSAKIPATPFRFLGSGWDDDRREHSIW